jgi:hypothetical protein
LIYAKQRTLSLRLCFYTNLTLSGSLCTAYYISVCDSGSFLSATGFFCFILLPLSLSFSFLFNYPALFSLRPYVDDSSVLEYVHTSGQKKSTPFAGTDASLPKHARPQMHQWMEYATVQTCNAA